MNYDITFLLILLNTIATEKEKFYAKCPSRWSRKSGTRDIIQVLANGLPSISTLICFRIFKCDFFLLGFYTGITEALVDSIASDVGMLSKKSPYNILTLKQMESGFSGGISLLGSISSLFAAFFNALLIFCFYIDLKISFIVLFTSYAGCILDSVFGARYQAKYYCPICKRKTEKDFCCGKHTQHISGLRFLDNCGVNFISNIISIFLSYILFICF
ncbi:MAG: DUF92 domain-containing protein [Firmicutes bacterium]|nr:DUF92 domain-containing protein [Bacillota bacterium]